MPFLLYTIIFFLYKIILEIGQNCLTVNKKNPNSLHIYLLVNSLSIYGPLSNYQWFNRSRDIDVTMSRSRL